MTKTPVKTKAKSQAKDQAENQTSSLVGNREVGALQNNVVLVLAAIALASGISACASSKNNQVTETAPTVDVAGAANTAAREAEAPYFVEVEFQKGSNQLTEQSRSAISSLLNRARAEGRVNDVKVLSWADQEYPTSGQK